jgi:quercetin dioxygenase-like cupin family protein
MLEAGGRDVRWVVHCAVSASQGTRARRSSAVANVGDVIENLVSGQRLIFRKTAQVTGGELLEVESIYTKPSPSRPPVHYHPRQEERFEVLSGKLHTLIGGEERTLREGKILVIPPCVPHGMWSEEAGTRVKWQTRPALKTEAFFETVWGLAKDGKVNDEGVPNLLRVALIAREYEEEYCLVSPPRAVQRVLFAALAPVGRLLGYPARYPYPYGSPEKPFGRRVSVDPWPLG